MMRILCCLWWTQIGLTTSLIAQAQLIELGNYSAAKISTSEELLDIERLIQKADVIRYSNMDSALTLAYSALKMSRKINYAYGSAVALRKIGSYYFDQSKYKAAKEMFFLAEPFTISSATRDNTMLPQLYSNIANAYAVMGDADSALHFYQKTILIIKQDKIQDRSLLVVVYANYGAFLSNYGSLEQSMIYLNKSLGLAKLIKDTALMAINYFNIGKYYQRVPFKIGSELIHDSAIHFFNKAYVFYGYSNNYVRMVSTLNEIGWTYLKAGNRDKAEIYFDSTIKKFPKESSILPASYWGRGRIKMAFDDYDQALPLLLKSLNLYNSIQALLNKHVLYRDISTCYYNLNNKDSAYHYLILYNNLRDDLLNEQQIQQISEQEVKYRTSEKEKELIAKELLLTKKSSQIKTRNLMILAIGSTSIALAGFLLSLYRRNKQKQRLQAEKLKRIEEQEKNKLLLAQMEGVEQERSCIVEELHDGIGGMLAAVKMNFSILKNKHEGLDASLHFAETLGLLNDTAGALRKTAHNLMPILLQQQSLAAALKDYCKKIQVDKKLTIEFQSYGMDNHPLNEELKRMVFLMVQELLQNVIKHAKATHVLVQMSLRDKFLHIMVEDNGIGMQTTPAGQDGIGLNKLKERVNAFGGSFEIETEAGKGTTIYMEFEIES